MFWKKDKRDDLENGLVVDKEKPTNGSHLANDDELPKNGSVPQAGPEAPQG
jgi:hypothetical protein